MIAVIGANGYIGKCLADTLAENFIVVRVTRDNYEELKDVEYDVVINCANNANRFWASQNPEKDYVETVEKTKNLIKKWNYKKFILISTLSARCEPDSIYGKNKLLAESLCPELSLIVRLTATYDKSLVKGILLDILKGHVYRDGNSRYSISSLKFVCNWIASNLGKTGLVEVGAKNSLSLREIADRLDLKVKFEGRIENQEVLNPEESFPDANDVIPFMKNMISSSL